MLSDITDRKSEDILTSESSYVISFPVLWKFIRLSLCHQRQSEISRRCALSQKLSKPFHLKTYLLMMGICVGELLGEITVMFSSPTLKLPVLLLHFRLIL